jgi:hypothetical protein
MNFEYNFGVPRSEQSSQANGDEANNIISTGDESQNSEYSSIDFSKIPQPTFRFGQFGQVSTESANSEGVDNTTGTGTGTATATSNNNASSGDDDSFLAEPSMSAGQFDASFNFQTQPTDPIFSPTNSTDSFQSSSVKSVPILVEEPLGEPVYLEEPTPHSVEELMKSTVDGDTSALMPEFLEQLSGEDINTLEEPAHTIQELLKTETEGGKVIATESWENIDEEEIKAAEAEFLNMEKTDYNNKEGESGSLADIAGDIEEPAESMLSEYAASLVDTSEPVLEEPKAHVKPEKKTKALAASKAKSPAVSKVKVTPKSAKKEETDTKAADSLKVSVAKKEKITEEPAVLTEGRAKRERKTVERLADSVIQPAKAAHDKFPAIPTGTGMKLGDIEAINHALGKKTSADKVVTMLHKLLFNRVGEAGHRKASIRAFCGDESANYENKLKKYTNAELLELTYFLGLTGAKEKSAIAARISNFLIKPNTESVKFTAKGERILKRVKKTIKPKPQRSSKRINPDADKKPLGRPPKGSKTSTKPDFLTPETVDSDVESEVEREVLGELNNS